MTTVTIQEPVSRYHSIRSTLSDLRWQAGVSTFFTENVPFSYSTSTWFASKILKIAHSFHADWLELGSGLGILSRHILDFLKQEYPQDYAQITLHLSDYAPALIDKMGSSGLFSEHPNTAFHVIDAHNPQLSFAPSMVLISYLLDSLQCRHIEIENGLIYELMVKSSIPSTTLIFDTSQYPPALLNAQDIQAILLGSDSEKKKRISPFLKPLLTEEFTRIPLENTSMSTEEKEDLKTFSKTLSQPHVRFNYAYGFSKILSKLFTQCKEEALLLIQDFGYTTPESLPEPKKLTSTYRTVICHAVYFPYLAYVAKTHGIHFNITHYHPGDTQLCVLYKGQHPDLIQARCKEVFASKDYDLGQKAVDTVLDFQVPDNSFTLQHILDYWETLSRFEKEDYLVTLSFASSCFEKGAYQEAVRFLQKLSPAYLPISIPAYHLLGRCYAQLGDLDKAESAFKKCMEISPEYPSAYNEMSFVHLKTKRYTDYLEMSQKFMQLTGETFVWEHFITQALVYLELGQKQKANQILDWIDSVYAQDKTLIPEKIIQKAASARLLF